MTVWAADAGGGAGSWIQVAIAIIGGAGGLAALVTTVLSRRKVRADAADVITDTALTLVEPLRSRVNELESEVRHAREETRGAHREASAAREQAEQANVEIRDLRTAVVELTTMLRHWRAAVLAPDATLERLRAMVTAERSGGGSRP